MTRDVRTQSIVLCVRKAGENNGTATILSRDYGIVYATLYGGPRSRLRGRVSQWNSGVMHLYCSHTGEMASGVKITDFDVTAFHLSFRECIYKDYAASVAAETAIATRCAGSPTECYTLVSAFLDGLEATGSGDAQKAALVRFLWRYLSLLGVQCDAASCAYCGGQVTDGAVYTDDGFVCMNCARARNTQDVGGAHGAGSNGSEDGKQNVNGELLACHGVSVSQEAARYLAAVRDEPPAIARSMVLDKKTLWELKAFTFMLLQRAVGKPLRSIKSGVGIL